MVGRKEPFDIDAWLGETEAPIPRPIHERYQATSLRPYVNPGYLAQFLQGATEFKVLGTEVPGYHFACPVCGGQAELTYGFTPEGPFNLTCDGRCSPGQVRAELQTLAPLAFEPRDDILFAIPAELRDNIIKAGLQGERIRQHREIDRALRSMRRKGGRITVADYTGPDGQTVLLIFRQDFDNGQKRFLPVHCYVDASDCIQLVCGFPKGQLPLYNWARLEAAPEKPVLAVEGEKTADAAQLANPQFVVVTSPCGSSNAGLADWSPVHGRDVIVWRDNDDAGLRYEKSAAAQCIVAGAPIGSKGHPTIGTRPQVGLGRPYPRWTYTCGPQGSHSGRRRGFMGRRKGRALVGP